MKKLALNGMQDYFALIVRRRWWLAIPALLIAGGTLTVALLLPDVYRSETVIVMDPREVPNDVVRDLVSLSGAERLQAVQQHILSRSNLLRVVNEFQSEFDLYYQSNVPEQVERLRNEIELETELNERAQQTPVSYFKIAYEERSPELAQRIVGRLASLFIEFDNRTREQQIFGTTEFLESEVARLTEELERADNELRVVKESFNNELPTQLDANLRSLDRLQQQLQINREALDRFVTLRLSLERQLSETPQQLRLESAIGTTQTPEQLAYEQKVRQLHELTARYTPNHPDVKRLQSELKELKQILPEEPQPEGVKPGPQPNPVYQQLTTQLEEVKTEISIRERERVWIQREISRHSARVQNTPRREQELAALVRQRDDLASQLNDLKSKLAQARMAENLETRQKGAQFVILDPASTPLGPSGPDRLGLILTGLFIGLAVGFGLALAVDMFDQKLWTFAEVESQFGLPVLAEIPQIASPQDTRRSRKSLAIAGASATAALLVSGVLVMQKGTHLHTLLGRFLTQIWGG